MNNKRPDYTMAWLCTFQIGGKTEAITFLTDDFETCYAEYLRIKKESKVPVVFSDHKIVSKGKLLLGDDMLSIEVVGTNPDGTVRQPIINAEEANLHPRRVQRMANNRRLDNADASWMKEHNKHIAEKQLQEPAPDKV